MVTAIRNVTSVVAGPNGRKSVNGPVRTIRISSRWRPGGPNGRAAAPGLCYGPAHGLDASTDGLDASTEGRRHDAQWGFGGDGGGRGPLGRAARLVAGTALVVGLVSIPAVAGASALRSPHPSTASLAGVVRTGSSDHLAFTARPRALTCTFNGSSNEVQNVSPGGTVAVACAGWPANDTVAIGEVSPLFLATQSQNEIDSAIQEFTTDGSGALHASFVVPSPFTAPDPAAVCPPTPVQRAAYGDCFLALADSAQNGGTVGLAYGSTPAPVAGHRGRDVRHPGRRRLLDRLVRRRRHLPRRRPGFRRRLLPAPGAADHAHRGHPLGEGLLAGGRRRGDLRLRDAPFYGSMGGLPLNRPVVDMAPTADGRGYWLVASDGGIFAFGDAAFHGSTGSLPLNQPVVGVSTDTATGGYWLVASDGGIFAFDAPFFGSTGSLHLNKPVNGMAATADNRGYWFVASDGGIFAFGDAAFHGSTGALRLNAPIVGMAADPATGGYWLVGSDGGIFAFGAPFYGAG